MSTVSKSRQSALQARLRHRHRVRRRAEGSERRHDPADLGEEERARVAARVSAEGVSALARRWTEPQWPNVKYPKIDFQAISYYSAPKPKQKLDSMDEVDPELLRTFEKLGVPMNERAALAGVAVDVDLRQRLGRDHLQGEARRGRHHLLLDLRGGAQPSGLVRKYLGSVVPAATTTTRRSTRRCSPTARSASSRRA